MFWWCKLTIENPVSFLLAFISMDSHSWPPNRIEGFNIKSIQLQAQYKKQSCCEQHFNSDTYPSLLILLVRSSQRLFVSTKMMVLFSFSLIISSRRRMSLKKNFKRQNKTIHLIFCKYVTSVVAIMKTSVGTLVIKAMLLTYFPSLHHCRHQLSAGCCG